MSDRSPQPQWRRAGWLAGLPVLALVWASATYVATPYFEAALKERAAAVIRDSAEAGAEPWLRVGIHGRDLIAQGEASEAQVRTRAIERLSAIPDMRRLVDRTAVIAQASPFVWTAKRVEAGRIAVSGNRPAEIGASALGARLKEALPPGTALDDEARAARGASPAFQSGAVFAVDALRRMKPGAVATLTDTAIALEGEADDAEAYAALTSPMPPQGFSLGRVAILAPLVEDFRFSVERWPDGSATLTGYVVSEAVRDAIRSALAAAAPKARVDDRMRTARGLPSSIDADSLGIFATRLAALVHDGSVTYADGAVSVNGAVIDTQAVGEIEGVLRDARPAGVSAGRVALTARRVSPYAVSIQREPDAVTISGHLPSPAARSELAALVRQRFLQEAVRDTTRIADGAPEGLMPTLKAMVAPLSTLARGQVEISDTAVSVAGESLYGESARRLQASLPTLVPRDWRMDAEVTSADAVQAYDAASCTRLFAKAVNAQPVRFAAGSSELKPDFYPVLDAIAELAKRCPDRRVEIVGHADPAGAPVPQVASLPEYTASVKPKEKPKPVKPSKDAKDAKGAKAKTAAKPEPEKAPETPPEPVLDLPQQRAAAIVDYLLKAGLEPARVVWLQTAQPLSHQQGIGFQFRS